MPTTLKLEANQTLVCSHTFKGSCILITPPIDEHYWTFRVRLSDKQAVVAFPKFCTMGIGFQYEKDWNTNLPFQTDCEEIFKHILHNKGDNRIPDDKVKAAIRMLQKACREFDARQN